MSGTRNMRRAMILPTMLLILLLLALLAASFTLRVQADYTAMSAVSQQIQTRMAAESGLQMATLFLRTNRNNVDLWYNNPDVFNRVIVWTPEDDKLAGTSESLKDDVTALRFSIVADDPLDDEDRCRYGLTDESAKLNLNTATAEQLTGLITQIATEDMIVNEMVAALIDWRDADDEIREFGAEREYYSGLESPYQPKNGPFDTVEELLMVRGFDARVLYGEDQDRNGILTPNEDDGEQTFPLDDADGKLNRGLYPYLSVVSREPNTAMDNKPRFNLLGDRALLAEQLGEYIDDPAKVNFIVANSVTNNGGGGGGGGGRGGGGRGGSGRGEEGGGRAGGQNGRGERGEQGPAGEQGDSGGRGGRGDRGDNGNDGDKGGRGNDAGGGGSDRGGSGDSQRQPRGEGGRRGGRSPRGGQQPAPQGDTGGKDPRVKGMIQRMQAMGDRQEGRGGGRLNDAPGSGQEDDGKSGGQPQEGVPPTGEEGQGDPPGGGDQQEGDPSEGDGTGGGSGSVGDGSGDGEEGEGEAEEEPFKLNSPADLLAIETGGVNPLTVEDLPVLMERTTIHDPVQPQVGLVNVLSAPPQVLRTVPGMTEEMVALITANRRGLTEQDASSTAWLVTQGVLELDAFRKIAPYLTVRGTQFTIESVGFGDHLGATSRLQIVVEMRGPVAQILYYRDLSSLGTIYPIADGEAEYGFEDRNN